MAEKFTPDKKYELIVEETAIPGLLVVRKPVHIDNRGWFCENWQRQKMVMLGLPDFGPVQNNVSYNDRRGATRGMHTEPWDKYVSVSCGSVFAAWIDQREGHEPQVFTIELTPDTAVFVPRGVANGYQALEDGTVYSYLVNEHWRQDAQYLSINLGDPDANIPWPIPLEQADVSDKDKVAPFMKDAGKMPERKILITGANGQLGTALRRIYPFAQCVDTAEFDITDEAAYTSLEWSDYGVIINAAAFTKVDDSEKPEFREVAWRVNAQAVAKLANVATKHRITIVHVSSDYVFDGTKEVHDEEEVFSPLNVYGASKAAGDIAVASAPQHYLIRTSWVIGEGANFVKTMAGLAERGVSPSVVDDQIGRPTFTVDLANGIKHLLETHAPYGTYNLTNDGKTTSWADIAKAVYDQTGHDPDQVGGVSTAVYFADKPEAAKRPLQSTLSLDKIKSAGFEPRDWQEAL